MQTFNNLAVAARCDATEGNSAQRHLLQLITNLGAGGAQRVFFDHGALLSEKHQVSEAVFNLDQPAIYESGNTMYSLDVAAGSTLPSKVSNLLRRAWRLRQLINQTTAEICISHMDGANWVNVLSGGAAKKVLIVHGTVVHDNAIDRRLQQLRTKLLIPRLYNRADATVAVSEGIRYELETFCGVRNVHVIPNFFDTESIATRANTEIDGPEEELFSRYPVLITSGRLHEQKQQWRLFPLLHRVKIHVPDVRLCVLGDGELRARLLSEAEQHELRCFHPWGAEMPFHDGYDVYFFGYKPNPFAYLRRSSLFLFPSGWEGFPMALGEAMICGVPVLSADCPTGPREILSPGGASFEYTLRQPEPTPYGILLPMADKPSFDDAWTDSIVSLLRDSTARESLALKARLRMKDFDRAIIQEKWHALIAALSSTQGVH